MRWHPYIDLWHVQAVSYQVKVFACLTEEEALHAILFGFVHDMVESGVPTSANDTTRLKVHISKPRQTPQKKGKKYMIHTWLWHFSQGSEEYPFQRANRKDFWSPAGKMKWVKDNLKDHLQQTTNTDRSELLPGTADRSTPPALVLKGRRAHQEPAAASYISLAKPRSASRWHSRRHAGKWHYLHLHSAPSPQNGNTYL